MMSINFAARGNPLEKKVHLKKQVLNKWRILKKGGTN
jgi:hypothetical protein